VLSLAESFQLFELKEANEISDFSCGNADLVDFFNKEAFLYQQQLFGQTYYFRHTESNKISCIYTLSNDSLKVNDLPNGRRKKVRSNIPHAKSLKSYPATLIGRLGVSSDFSRSGLGCQILNLIKYKCLTETANQCRFIIVDSYNIDKALQFYLKNDFLFLWPTEEQERQHYKIKEGSPLNTRFMYFDLLPWSITKNAIEQQIDS